METKKKLLIGTICAAAIGAGVMAKAYHINFINKIEIQKAQIQLLLKNNLEYKISGETICFPKEFFTLNSIAVNGCYRLVKLENKEHYDSLVKTGDGDIYDVNEIENKRITEIITSLDLKSFEPKYIKVDQQTINDIANYAKGKKDLVAKLNKEIASKYVAQ